MNIERTRAICPRSSICRNQKLKGTCISYIVNNDLFSIVHNIWIYVYITKHYMYVSSEKSVYISEENGAILNFFFCCLHHGVVLWSSSWKGFTAAYNIRRSFQFIPKNVYMEPCTCTWVCPLHIYMYMYMFVYMYMIPTTCLKYKTFIKCLWQNNVYSISEE